MTVGYTYRKLRKKQSNRLPHEIQLKPQIGGDLIAADESFDACRISCRLQESGAAGAGHHGRLGGLKLPHTTAASRLTRLILSELSGT